MDSRYFNTYQKYLFEQDSYEGRSFRDGDDDDNDIIDLDAIDLEVNTDINFVNSGGAAAATAGASATVPIIAPTAFATGAFAQAIPVVGQVVAVIATCVAIGQVFHNQDKIGQYKRIVSKTKASLAEKQTLLIVDQEEHDKQLAFLDREIAYREAQIARTQTMQTIVLVTLSVSSLIFTYGIIKLSRK